MARKLVRNAFITKKYIGAVEDWAKGLANVLEKDLNSKSFYK